MFDEFEVCAESIMLAGDNKIVAKSNGVFIKRKQFAVILQGMSIEGIAQSRGVIP